MIKTFRGKLADGGTETIRLSTNNGMTGYKIHKFQVMAETPTTVSAECVVKIFSVEQSSGTATVDFTDSTLLAVALWTSDGDTHEQAEDLNVIFDNVAINQDIFITHQNTAGGAADCNYYLELEQIKLDLNENTVATLKDIRNLS